MILDRRFAIVIGINDYDDEPLKYCVNDALAVAKILEDKCAFKHEDIFPIISDTGKSIKDISGHFDFALKEIEKVIKPQYDSILFYFAGHGEYQHEASGLEFHDSLVEIRIIFQKINLLQPKYQFCIIDACESGGKVLTRGRTKANIIEKYISKSTGVLCMYAATETEKAKEYQKINHGLFTYYFLNAINNNKIYDEGILTPSRIGDYIAKETQKESQFKQTPVIETRSIGYYPFAFKKSVTATISESLGLSRSASEKSGNETEIYFPEIPGVIRTQIFEEIKGVFAEQVEEAVTSLVSDDYELEHGKNVTVFDSSIADKITESIVIKSRNENVEAVNEIFWTDKVENQYNSFLSSMSLIDSFLHGTKSKYTYYQRIDWSDEGLIAHSFLLNSKSIYKASCGITLIAYQAIFGIGVAAASFSKDYTGYGEAKIIGPTTEVIPFKIHAGTAINIQKSIDSKLQEFRKDITNWNKKRENKILTFDRKAI